MIFGWIAIILAVFSLLPSYVPGAMSLVGVLISLTALVISVFSVKKNQYKYFQATLIIVVGGLLLVNDGLRIWDPLKLSVDVKLVFYSLSSFVIVGCLFAVTKILHK